MPELTALELPDSPARWEALGFSVLDGSVLLPGVRLELGADQFTVSIEGVVSIEGLALRDAPRGAPVYSSHPNCAIGIDHVVALTPDFDRTATALAEAGLPLKRVRDAGGFRQGFRRIGGPILELVEASDAPAPGWWGVTITVRDLDALPADLVGTPKPAVQPGRLIATARSPGIPLAFMTPDPG